MKLSYSICRFILFISLPALLFLTGGCEKEIEFEYKDLEPIPVVEGSLTQYGAEVSLTLTTPMDEPIDRRRLTDATMTLTDLTLGESVMLHPDPEGIYRSPLGGISGHEYRLCIEREGESYHADCLMRDPTEIIGMEFGWIKMPYDDVAVLQVSFRDDPSSADDCYWLRIYRNGRTYKWAEISDLLASDGIINEVMMTTRRDIEAEDEGDLIEDGDLITATLVPISRGMHDYLEALSVGNSNGPRMLEGDFCLGYFLAAPISEKSVIFSR